MHCRHSQLPYSSALQQQIKNNLLIFTTDEYNTADLRDLLVLHIKCLCYDYQDVSLSIAQTLMLHLRQCVYKVLPLFSLEQIIFF